MADPLATTLYDAAGRPDGPLPEPPWSSVFGLRVVSGTVRAASGGGYSDAAWATQFGARAAVWAEVAVDMPASSSVRIWVDDATEISFDSGWLSLNDSSGEVDGASAGALRAGDAIGLTLEDDDALGWLRPSGGAWRAMLTATVRPAASVGEIGLAITGDAQVARFGGGALPAAATVQVMTGGGLAAHTLHLMTGGGLVDIDALTVGS